MASVSYTHLDVYKRQVYVQDLADFVAINKQLSGYEFYPLYVMDLAKIAYTG